MRASEAAPTDGFVQFGPFRFQRSRRLLERADQPVPLSRPALDILAVLLERAGRVVSQQDLMATVWPDSVAEAATLRVHIAALRKALGDGQDGVRYLTNIKGRGYCFVGEISTGTVPKPAPIPPAAPIRPPTPPASYRGMIGRDAVVDSIATQLLERRFVTIAGAGGIGKTAVAHAVADRLAASFEGAVHFVEFASLDDPALVPSTVASNFELPLQSAQPLADLIAYLGERRTLIVLDNCEHVIGAAAALAEEVFRTAPRVHILATSRESLWVDGEQMHQLAPLATPPAGLRLTAEQAAHFSAVQLFVERASASSEDFRIDDTSAPMVAEICRSLDGMPLAIELAAARVGSFGLDGIAAGLGDLFSLLTKGWRTALPRHQTLLATLDWSYALLSPADQIILQRLSVFRDHFDLDSAIAIAACPEIPSNRVIDGIADLIAKSLLTADIRGETSRYRLLHTTRAYAARRLSDSAEQGPMARRHAEHCVGLFAHLETDWSRLPKANWLAHYADRIDDLRTAIDWSLADGGDPGIGFALMATSGPLWFALSLVDEFIERAERALQSRPAEGSDHEMVLNLWLSTALFNARGPTVRMAETCTRALVLSEQLQAPAYRRRALWTLAGERILNGDYAGNLALTERFRDTSADDKTPAVALVTDRMMALALHLVGRHDEARPCAERALTHAEHALRNAYTAFHQYDTRAASRAHLTRILWAQGLPDEAAANAAEGVELALSLGYPPSTCYILVFAAIPIAFWRGDHDSAARYIQLLHEQRAGFSFSYWQTWRRQYEGALHLGPNDGSLAFRTRVDRLVKAGSGRFIHDYLGTIREELAGPETIARAEAGLSGWCAPEILRAKGANLLREDLPDALMPAEALFRRALDLAHQQGALSWELRAALSLARLLRDRDRGLEGKAILAPVLGRFSEGFATADLMAARDLLGS